MIYFNKLMVLLRYPVYLHRRPNRHHQPMTVSDLASEFLWSTTKNCISAHTIISSTANKVLNVTSGYVLIDFEDGEGSLDLFVNDG